ncbi:hypothetical protein DSO57_1018534 [Entomophthora muscae]|uniref:Uncharacterized protein n=1 Tax=Entomophthora muscae TaxID=34485 RepID=A0ACC2U2A9_9FUNG|nr:hypothetical protein DSO57_1018534 [Entomophthora muscae]
MVFLPVGSLVTILDPSVIIHHLGRLLPSGWVPDTAIVNFLDTKCEAAQVTCKSFWGYPTCQESIMKWVPENL